MSRLRLLQGVARGLAKLTEGSKGQKVGAAALKQVGRLKAAAKGAKPIAQQVAREKAKATGKPVRTTIQTAARQATIQRQAARSAKNPPSGDRLLLQEKGINRTTKNTKLAPGVKSDATKPAPVSRTTRPTKAEQVRQVKSNLRDRGSAHVQTKVPQDTNATTNRARGSRLDQAPGATRGQFSEANKETARQAVRRGQFESRVSGDVRENGRTAGRNAAERFRNKADKVISDRLSSDKAMEMSGVDRRTMRNNLTRQARQGENRVRHAAENAVTGQQRSSKLNQSPSSSSQDIGRTGSRRSLAQTQPSAERLTRDMSARKAAGQLPEIKKDLPSTGGPKAASTEEGVKKAVTPPKKDLTSSQTAKPLAKPEAKPNPIRNGKELKPQGETSIPQSMNTSQRRADPSPQQQRSDAALRQRNQRPSVQPTRTQGSTTGVAAAANRSVDRQGNNLQKIMEQAAAARDR